MQQSRSNGKIKAGFSHGKGQWKSTRLYTLWAHMRARCLNTGCPAYSRYGGRGISICENWIHDFQVFARWALANGHRQGLQIDRQDNDGNYTPENCRFVTARENSSNKRNNTQIVGVSWYRPREKWRARITYQRRTYHLGLYADKEIAAFAYELALYSIKEVENG